ncbi:PAS domain-containing protein [Deferrisoma palaeochoriense]
MTRWFLSVALAWLLAAAPPVAARSHRLVVVVHSYHQGLSWVDRVNDGLWEELGSAEPAVDLRFEYLDTKSHRDPAYLDLQERLLAAKYASSPPAVVVACDNNALEFLRQRRDRVFGPVPVVFCGINGFSDDLVTGLAPVTGVAEEVAFRENLEFIRRVHPNLSALVVYGTDTPTFRMNRRGFEAAAREFGMEALLRFRAELPAAEAAADAARLSSGSVAVLLDTLRDADGTALEFGRAARRLREALSVPLYSFWDVFLGHGIVGGKLVSGAAQGRAAGRLVLRILEGADPANLRVLRAEANPWLFDHRELERYGIDEDLLPAGSRVLFRPPGFWERYGPVAGPVGLVLFLLGGIAVVQAADARRQRRARQAVRKTRDFLQTILDGVAEPILVIDREHRLTLLNRAARELNPNPEATTCHAVSHGQNTPCDTADHPCPLEEVIRTGQPVTTLHVHKGPGGEDRRIEILASPLENDRGEVTGIVETMRDVTERFRAFEQVRRAKQDWERTFDAVPDLIALIGPGHRIRRVNRALAERLGTSPQELVGRPCYEVIHGRDAPHPGCPHVRMLHDGKPHVAEVHEPHLGGYFFVSTSPLPAGEGGPGCVHVARDITDLKRAQAALEAERNRLRVTLESIGDGVIAVDAQGRVVLLNPTAEALTGWSAREAQGRPLDEVFRIVNETTREPAQNPVQTVLSTGRIAGLAHHTLLLSREGRETAIADSAAPIRNERGDVVGAVLVFRDVTEERRRERERARAQHLESLGVLAGGIAHDFNNLLMGISANLEAARRKVAPSDPAYPRLAQAEAACFRATQLTRQLLTFARGGDPVRQTVHLAEHLEEWARFPLRGSNVALDLRLAADLPPVDADPGQLEQVVTNLVLNARQAMPRGGTVRVAAGSCTVEENEHPGLAAGNYVVLEVEDTGIGIPPEHLPKIFDPYFTTKQTGSGLGLATVHSIVRRHGGTVTVASKLGEGTRFRVYLPAATAGSAPVSPEAPEPAGPGARPSGAARILVMDDEEMLRDVLCEVLEDMGYQVEATADGEEAVERYREEREAGRPFDLVILDLTVPAGVGGQEALRRIREFDPGVRAVASSGYASDPVLANPGEHGFAGSVAKPYRLDELDRVIRSILGRADVGTPPAF